MYHQPVLLPVLVLCSATALARGTTHQTTTAAFQENWCSFGQEKWKTSRCPRVLRRFPANPPLRPRPARQNPTAAAQTSANCLAKPPSQVCSESVAFAALWRNLQMTQLPGQFEKAAAWVSCEPGSCRAAALRWTTDRMQEQATFALKLSTELTSHSVACQTAQSCSGFEQSGFIATSSTNAKLTAILPFNLIMRNDGHFKLADDPLLPIFISTF